MLKNTKRLLSLVLCIAMTLSLLPVTVLAAEAGFTLTVVPSITEAEVGDTVTFQVFGQGSDITALQFRLNCPEGMTYVANSASVPSGLRDSLGWAATDWTESSVTWTGYNADPADFPEGTLLLTFDCIMDEPGEYQVDFDDYYAFDADFDETTSALDSEAVIVGPLVPGTEPVTDPSIVSSLTVSAGPAVETAVVGDIVTFNVYVRGESFCGLSFDLEIPEGLRFVPGSGSTPPLSNGNVGYWWSEDTMNFAMSYTSPLTFSEDSWMLSFSCVAEIPGTYSIGLKNLTAYDNWSDDLVPNLVVQTLCVSEAPSFCAIEILPEQDSVTLGDTVSVEICASGNGLTALQFNLDFPAGLTYVSGSASIPSDLKSSLGVAGGIDWNEEALMWTMYNDVPITIPAGTVLMTFQCTADAAGTYELMLKELLPFDEDFEEFAPTQTFYSVTVESGNTGCAHSFEDRWEILLEPTCRQEGLKVRVCSVCGARAQDTLENTGSFPSCTGSDYTLNMNKTFPSFSIPGAESLVLHFSAASELESTYDKLYVYAGDTVDTGTLVGTYSGSLSGRAITVNADTFTLVMTSDGSVTKYGFEIESIDYAYPDATTVLPTVDHAYGDGVYTSPTCVEGGYVTYTCKFCANTLQESNAPALGHSYDEGVVTKATCTEDGCTTYTCQACGYVKTEIDTVALGHQFLNGFCSNCGVPEGAFFQATVKASQTEVQVGDTIDYTVYGYGTEVCGMQFQLAIPSGLSYVPNSAVIPSDLKSQLGWAGLDWTEESMMWTGYNDLAASFEPNTVILTFSVVAEKTGKYDVELRDPLPFDQDYREFTPYIKIDTVTVGCSHDQLTLVPRTVTCTEAGNVAYYLCNCSRLFADATATVELTEADLYANALGHTDDDFNDLCDRCGISLAVPGNTFMDITIQAIPSATTQGSDITYYVYGHGNDVVALQFELDIPEGMEYVANSGRVPANLREDLGLAGAVDWTEESMFWSMYNDVSVTIPEDTLLMVFTCTADAPGSYTIGLKELYPFDGNFEEFEAQYTCDTVTVTECAHSYTSETTSEATCTAPGEIIHRCTLCGNSYTEFLPALGHSFIKGTCTLCGEDDPNYSGSFFTATVVASPSPAVIGEAVEFTVYGHGEAICALEFELTIPEGMTYVPNSAAVPSDLRALLGWAAADWTESSMMWTGYNDTVTNIPEDTVLLTFSCIPDLVGRYRVELRDLLAFDRSYQEIATTCTMDYLAVYDCAQLGHSWIDATCDTPKTCSRCGTTEGSALGHEFGSAVVTVQPTCTSDGLQVQTCIRCPETKSETVPMTGHSHEAVVTPPTCTQGGYTTYTCHCGDTYTGNQTAALDHSWIDATCTTPKTCDRCGTTEGSALGHEFGNAVVTVQPTCTQDGLQVKTCIRCPETKSETVPMTGHSHEAVVTAPTCTQEGYTTYTCHCGDTYTGNRIPATGHSHQAAVTAPTCTLSGYTTYTCHCGDSYVANYTAPLGHNERLTTVNPTCTLEGSKTYTCIACGNVRSEVIPATGHTHQAVVTAPTCTEGGYTTHICHCGDSYTDTYTDALGHKERSVSVQATCTEDGSVTYTCTVCGNVRSEVIPATGHSYEATVIAPTCTVSGYTYHECGSCGNNYVDTYVPATGHRYQAVVTPPTATEQGYTTYTCAQCADSYITDYTAPLGLTLTGSFVSGGEGKLTFELLQDGQVVHSITVDGKTGSYSIPFILPGDYTLKISKGTHTFREYPVTVDANPTTLDVQLCLIGDVTGDGRVNVGDVSRLYSHARKTNLLSGYPLQVAELTGEGRVNVGDVSRLYAHARKTDPLW